MFKQKKIRRINPKKCDSPKKGEPFWVIDDRGIVLAEGKIPKRSKDGTGYVEVEVIEDGWPHEIALQRCEKWYFADLTSSYFVRPGDTLDLTLIPKGFRE